MTREDGRLVGCEGQTGVGGRGEGALSYRKLLSHFAVQLPLEVIEDARFRFLASAGEKVRSKSVGRPSFTRESGTANVFFMVMTLTLFALVPLLVLPRDAAVGGLLPDIPKAIPQGLVSP